LQLNKVSCAEAGGLGTTCSDCGAAGTACAFGSAIGVCDAAGGNCVGKKQISLDKDDKYKTQRKTIENRENT